MSYEASLQTHAQHFIIFFSACGNIAHNLQLSASIFAAVHKHEKPHGVALTHKLIKHISTLAHSTCVQGRPTLSEYVKPMPRIIFLT